MAHTIAILDTDQRRTIVADIYNIEDFNQMSFSAMNTEERKDVTLVLSALADTLRAYPVEELAEGWREAADRLVRALAPQNEDEGSWDVLRSNSDTEGEVSYGDI